MRRISPQHLMSACVAAVLLLSYATPSLAGYCDPPVTPSVSVSCSAPNQDREVDCLVNYVFPGEGSRYLVWSMDGGGHTPPGLDNSGVIRVHRILPCTAPDGNGVESHVFSALVQSCGSPAATAHAETTITLNPTPSVSIAYDGPGDVAEGTLYISYNLPYTGSGVSSAADRKSIHVVGPNIDRHYYPLERVGQITDTLGLGCRPSDTYTLTATATSCPGWQSDAATEITLNHKPSVSVSFPYNDTRAVISYNFPQSPDQYKRTVELRWAETDAVIKNWNPINTTHGTLEASLSCPTDKASLVYAVAWNCDEEAKSGTVSIPPCKLSCAEGGTPDAVSALDRLIQKLGGTTPIGPTCECTGDPVDVTNGNMEYVERDALPGGVLGRTYHSKSGAAGVFGLGWVSMFDARVKTTGSGNSVLLQLDDNRRYVFQLIDNVYRQVFPAGDPRSGTLESISGGFRHRIGGSNVYREFQNGRLVRIGIAGRESTTINYDATTGKPTAVADSLGRWAWNLAFTSSGYLETISLAGNSELVWTYGYANGLLQTVTGPSAAPWRTYRYNQSRLEVIKDGAGKVIESHTYDSTGRAISSSGPTAEITNIQYGRAGRVSGEWKTTVTTADGAKTDYYFRYIAGRMRIVEIDGECHCASEDSVFARNQDGLVVREQDVRGYITVRTYADGRTQTVGRYRPASCDPETATGVSPCRLTPDTLATVPLVAAPQAF